MKTNAYRVHGMMQSYFTRKMTGYLDYKGIPWLFRRFPGVSAEAMAAGFPGGVPVVETPAGEFMWDSTPMIHHLELRFPEPSVLPTDPVQRFLCYVLEDAADEWFYRPAVGSRWHFAENHAVGGFELARDIAVKMPVACDQAYAGVGEHVRSSCPPLGVTAENIRLWIDDVLRPWFRVLGAHLARRPLSLRRAPVACRLRALRRQRRALHQRSALPAVGGGGRARHRAAHAPSARARGSAVRRVGRSARGRAKH